MSNCDTGQEPVAVLTNRIMLNAETGDGVYAEKKFRGLLVPVYIPELFTLYRKLEREASKNTDPEKTNFFAMRRNAAWAIYKDAYAVFEQVDNQKYVKGYADWALRQANGDGITSLWFVPVCKKAQ